MPDLGYGENGPVWIIHEDYDTVWGMPVIWPKGEESEYQPRSPNYGPDEEPPSNNVVVEISNNDENDMEVEFHLKRPGVQIRSDDEDEFVEEFDEASTSTGIRRESARLKSLGAVNYERYRVVVRRKTEQGKRKKTRIIERE